MPRKPITNGDGVLHLHISGAQPEAAELQQHVESMHSKNTDHAAEPVFNPAVSGAQRRLERVSKKNRGVLKMTKGQLRDYASTKGL